MGVEAGAEGFDDASFEDGGGALNEDFAGNRESDEREGECGGEPDKDSAALPHGRLVRGCHDRPIHREAPFVRCGAGLCCRGPNL